jgi:uncharacterized protein (DUF2141 family)
MRWLAATIAAGAGLAGGVAALAQGSGDLKVEVRGLRNSQGQIACSLYASAAGFPGDLTKAARKAVAPISGDTATCHFNGAAPGEYAVSVIHDENMNGKLDKNFIGMPTEGIAASNDPDAKFGPPKFDAAKFSYAGGAQTIVVHMHYYP